MSRNKQKKYNTEVLLKNSDGKCALCKLPFNNDISRDHIIPESLGGTSHINNLQLVHVDCNRMKGDSLNNIFSIEQYKENYLNKSEKRKIKGVIGVVNGVVDFIKL